MREADRIIRLKTVLSEPGCPDPPSTARSPRERSRPQLKISTNGSGWHKSDINRWVADPVSWRPKCQCDEVR